MPHLSSILREDTAYFVATHQKYELIAFISDSWYTFEQNSEGKIVGIFPNQSNDELEEIERSSIQAPMKHDLVSSFVQEVFDSSKKGEVMTKAIWTSQMREFMGYIMQSRDTSTQSARRSSAQSNTVARATPSEGAKLRKSRPPQPEGSKRAPATKRL